MPTPSMSRRGFGAAALMAASAVVLGGRAAAATDPAPAAQRYAVPGEFEPHAGTLMAWPHETGGAGWSGHMLEAQAEIAGLAKTVARFERVIMAAHPSTAAEARAQCGPTVEVMEYDVWDCWTRDNGPVFTVNPSRTAMIGLDFVFNGWGNKYAYGNDDNLPIGACDYLGVPRTPINMVLEGGSVIQDGQGTLIVTEECLLNPNRNPTMDKTQIENALLDAYGAQKVIWLPYGLDGDYDTDGHVDLCTSYVGPAKLLILTQPGTASPNEQRMAANKAVLQASTDARGRSFELTEIHAQPRWFESGRDVLIFSYTNHYPVNGGVIVPLAGVPEDATALSIIGGLYPDREVVGVSARTLAWNGGQLHCVTQQIPLIG
ncbi:agmatine deiminase family protein [Streptomyces exfoliatus]|uniref:agmatine deiminase family protein n=1 Tax=Streptomyces exfoliatus TaxID=1905 RepID=UPI00324AAE36